MTSVTANLGAYLGRDSLQCRCPLLHLANVLLGLRLVVHVRVVAIWRLVPDVLILRLLLDILCSLRASKF